MSRKKAVTKKEINIITNTWSNEEAREFLLKGGTVYTTVTNYKADGEISSISVTEKQITPDYRLHQAAEVEIKNNPLADLRKELK